MKNVAMFVFCMGIALPLIISCAGGGQVTTDSRPVARNSGVSFNEAEGKEWVLSEIRSARTTTQIDLQKLAANNIGGFFTIHFQDGNVSGMGAPNRYRGPYTDGNDGTLSLGNLASTMMASFIEVEELKEHEYYTYLGKVTRWSLSDGKLELHSSNTNGADTVLVFVLK